MYQPIPLPGGTATVQEDRYEVMGTYGRALTPKATLQVSLGGEYSKLEQVGGGGLVRTFRRTHSAPRQVRFGRDAPRSPRLRRRRAIRRCH